MVETMIRKSRWAFVRYLRSSKVFGTLCFMVFSSVIISKLDTGIVKQFWYKQTVIEVLMESL